MIESAQGKILFSDKELACRHCGKLVLALGFAEKLKELRLESGLPMTLSPCCRCSEPNRQEGGNAGSFHLTENIKWKVPGTCAIDVVRRGAEYDRKLLSTALTLGWSIGIAKTFIHLDRRSDYTGLKAALFTY